jgi:hypothetical protein
MFIGTVIIAIMYLADLLIAEMSPALLHTGGVFFARTAFWTVGS